MQSLMSTKSPLFSPRSQNLFRRNFYPSNYLSVLFSNSGTIFQRIEEHKSENGEREEVRRGALQPRRTRMEVSVDLKPFDLLMPLIENQGGNYKGDYATLSH